MTDISNVALFYIIQSTLNSSKQSNFLFFFQYLSFPFSVHTHFHVSFLCFKEPQKILYKFSLPNLYNNFFPLFQSFQHLSVHKSLTYQSGHVFYCSSIHILFFSLKVSQTPMFHFDLYMLKLLILEFDNSITQQLEFFCESSCPDSTVYSFLVKQDSVQEFLGCERFH